MSFDLDICRAGSSLPYIQVRVKVMGQSSRFGDEKVFLYGYDFMARRRILWNARYDWTSFSLLHFA